MRCRSCTPTTIVSSLVLALLITSPVGAQDVKPDPADVAAVKDLLQRATRAMLDKDSRTFVACCDDFVDCFFLDGTLIQGQKRIAATLDEFFSRRPEGLVARLDALPRSFRVLSPESGS